MSRHNYRWSINELLSLQREYELLRLSIPDIAKKHKRTPSAIIHKLIDEDLLHKNDYYNNSDCDSSSSINDELYDDEEDDDDVEESEEVTEKKELPVEDKDVEYIYIHEYLINLFYNYYFPDKISYRYKLL